MTTGDEAPEEIQEALGHQTYRAKRCYPVVGTAERPSDWDKAHGRINDYLDALDRTAALV